MSPKPLRLRVLSYNIHHGAGIDKKLDLERIASVIKSVEPDLVGLQEVDRNVERTGKVDQVAKLAELTKMHSAFGGNLKLQGGDYGNAVLSKLPITRAGAKGYTISAAEGEGPRHLRSGDLCGENIRIETITTPAVADELLARLAADYFPYYAIIAFVSEVRIVRGDHYV